MGKQSRRPGRRDRHQEFVGTQVTIAVTPQRDEITDRISLETELRMVRSALLYVDRVNLIAPSVSMVWDLRPFADIADDNVLRRVAALSPQAFISLGMPATHVAAAKKMLRRAARQSPGGSLRTTMESKWLPVVETLRNQANTALAAEDAHMFDPALQSGALIVHGEKFTRDGDTDEQIDWFIQQISDGLSNPSSALMLDPFTAERVGQDAGLSFASESLNSKARRAAVGSGFIERLSAFPDAPMSLVLEAREELAEGRAQYRTATRTLAAQFESHALDDSLPHEIDEVWNDEVRPALKALQKSVSATQLARESLKATVTGKITPSSVAVGITSFLGGVLPTISTSAFEVGAVGVATQAVSTVYKARSEYRKHNLVYLADLQAHLAK